MSATNTTTNYSLPIFIETDKPAWLVDFNGAMRTIDATLKTNADAIATKSPILTFNDTSEIDFTKTGDIVTAHLASGVSDKVGRALVTPVAAPAADQLVAIDTNGSQAAIEIGSGLFNDSGTLKAVDLNLIVRKTITAANQFRQISGGYSSVSPNITVATNADGSIGKVYGYIIATGSSNNDLTFKTGVYVSNPSGTDYSIFPSGIDIRSNNAGSPLFTTIRIEADGEISLVMYAATVSTTGSWFPSFYIFNDFGDTPT